MSVDAGYDRERGEYGIDMYAPAGLRFGFTECHSYVSEDECAKDAWNGAWEAVITLEPCDNVPCDGCKRYA